MTQGPASPSVSVVIGSYNAAAWIREAIDSVLTQTHPVLEIVVVDDGSTDATPAIVGSYENGVQLLTEQHRGRPHRNRGILASSGDMVAFVDADDYWHPEKLERQLKAMLRSRAEWAICDSQWLHETSGLLTRPAGEALHEGDILETLFLNNFIVASSALVSRRVLDSVGHFDESSSVAPVEDWDLWLRIAARFPVACVRERLVTLRLHEGSFLASTPLYTRVTSLETVVDRAAAREPARLGPLRAKALFNVYFAAGVSSFRRGKLQEARGFFVRAWRKRPARLETVAYVALTYMDLRTSRAMVNTKRRISRWR